MLISNKKSKLVDEGDPSTEAMEEDTMSHVSPTSSHGVDGHRRHVFSYSNVIRGMGHTHSMGFQNPLFSGDYDIEVSDGESVVSRDTDEMNCPVIRLSKEEKIRLRKPWLNALIIKLFDKRMRYEDLIRILRLKWSLKGDISLIDVGCAYYIIRFTNLDDYNFVLTQGPWMIGDSYLTIRKWIPNFVPDEEPIKVLTAWVRILNLSVEYFDKVFLNRIGERIGTLRSANTLSL